MSAGEYLSRTEECGSSGNPDCYCEADPYWAVYYGDEEDCSNLQLRYWYHPDYLGSVEYVTDENGEAYQYFFRSPWGKKVEDQKASGVFSSAYKFNGKEQDEETGNYYYGARYYTAELGIWLSVDPMSDQRPYLTPYNFVQNNPINLVDPTGLLDTEPGDPTKVPFTDEGPLMRTNNSNPHIPLPVPGRGLSGGATSSESSMLNEVDRGGGNDPKLTTQNQNRTPENIPKLESKDLTLAATFAVTVSKPMVAEGGVILGEAASTLGPIAFVIAMLAMTGDSESLDKKERMRDELAHTPKKQSTGSTSKGTAKANRHAKQYRHGGKNRKKNPNQRKGAEERKNKGR
jgi:RHS repeat-associated protein